MLAMGSRDTPFHSSPQTQHFRDSDLWSFDAGDSESIDSTPSSQPPDTTKPIDRQNHRTRSTPRKERKDYSSPPPDYRTTIRNTNRGSEDSVPIGLVPSHFDVGGLYRGRNAGALTLPTSPVSDHAHSPDNIPENRIGDLVRDASVKASPLGFKEIVKGWNEWQTKRRALGGVFKKEKGVKTASRVNGPAVPAKGDAYVQKGEAGGENNLVSELPVDQNAMLELDTILGSPRQASKTSAVSRSLTESLTSGEESQNAEGLRSRMSIRHDQPRARLNATMPTQSMFDQHLFPSSNRQEAFEVSSLSRCPTRLEDVPEHETCDSSEPMQPQQNILYRKVSFGSDFSFTLTSFLANPAHPLP